MSIHRKIYHYNNIGKYIVISLNSNVIYQCWNHETTSDIVNFIVTNNVLYVTNVGIVQSHYRIQ